ncbi:MAG: c-type cytochrome [Actinomycetota bacterium]|nr:c-type cytochrome [Actinomycetota bacterium]
MTPRTARRRHPLAGLAVLLLALLATGAVYSVLAPTADRAEAAAADEDLVAEGRELFLSNCATCHGLSAEGSTDGPSLIGVGAAAVDFQVGTGRMPLAQPGPQEKRKPTQFTRDQIRAMAAYIATLGPGPAIPEGEALEYENLSAEEIAEGGEIFRTNCTMCHNYAGAGGALTEGKFAPALYDVLPVHVYEAMLTGPAAMPVFSDTQLSTEDKRKIIGYLKSIEDEPAAGLRLGQLGPVSEGLFEWTIGLGSLIACAVWLGAKAK